jgi:hypothetical protein
MPLNARLTRLERSLATRPAAISAEQVETDRLMRRIMSDPVAHDLFTRIVELTPDAIGNPNFDFAKAAHERPGLAESVADLSNCLGAASE